MKFGTSGIRGIYGKDITDEKVMNLMKEHSPDRVVVSNDARPFSVNLKHSAISAMLSCGSDVYDIGMVPTGVNAFVSRMLRSYGIQFTASHNPPEYAGLKFFSQTGRGMKKLPPHSPIGKGSFHVLNPRPLYYSYLDKFLRIFKPIEKVLLDVGNGSASGFIDEYFRSRDLDYMAINNYPDALNPNRPLEPKPDTLVNSIKFIKSSDCEIGAAFDGDADRVVFFDKEGFLGFNEMIAIISKHFIEKTGASKKVVTTIESGLMFDQMMDDYKVTRTVVGDINVSEKMPDFGVVGVEQPGHYIFWDLYPAPDVLLPVLVASSIGVNKIRETIESYDKTFFKKISVKSDNKYELVKRFRERVGEFDYKEIFDKDGVFLKGDGWVLLVRASGTEDVIRISADSYSEKQTDELIEKAKELIL